MKKSNFYFISAIVWVSNIPFSLINLGTHKKLGVIYFFLSNIFFCAAFLVSEAATRKERKTLFRTENNKKSIILFLEWIGLIIIVWAMIGRAK